MNVATAAFTGMEKMHLNSIMLVVQSIVKTGIVIALVLLGFGSFGAVTGFHNSYGNHCSNRFASHMDSIQTIDSTNQQ